MAISAYLEPQVTGFVGALAIGLGFAFLASLLFKIKQPKSAFQDRPTSTSLRGSFVPRVMGRRRVGAVILAIGDRIKVTKSSGGGKKSPKITNEIYFEQRIDALCVGPAHRLHGIFINGVLIEGSAGIAFYNTPSGATLDFGDHGSCRIYWGEMGQPLSSLLTSLLGIATRAPRVCRIEWDRLNIGGGASSPLIEYEIEVRPFAENPPVTKNVVETLPNGDEIRGVTTGYAVWELFTAPYPYGAGLPSSWLSLGSLVELNTVTAVDEVIGHNLLIEDGEEIARVLAGLMDDAGFILPQCPDGTLATIPIREKTAVQDLSDDLLAPPHDEIEHRLINLIGDAFVYEYPDQKQNFHVGTIDLDDDSVGEIRNRRQTRKVTLSTITHRKWANRVVRRRSIGDLAEAVRFDVTAMRGLRGAMPGQVFLLGDLTVRLMGLKVDFKSPRTELDLIVDAWNEAIYDFDDPELPGGGPIGEALADLRFQAIEVPFFSSAGVVSLAVARHRAHRGMFGAKVWISTDGITYTEVGHQNAPATGGVLAADFTTPPSQLFIEYGPVITIDQNGDETGVALDLDTQIYDWFLGKQIMLVGDEIFFVRSWEVITPTTYRPRGLLRSRFESEAPWGYSPQSPTSHRAHAAGTAVFLLPSIDLEIHTSDSIQTGATRFVKTQPFGSAGIVPLSFTSPQEITLKQNVVKPLPPRWVRFGGDGGSGTSRRDGTYYDGHPQDAPPDDLIFEWLWTDKTLDPTPSGAGYQGAGNSVGLPAFSDSFEIQVWAWTPSMGSNLIRTETVTAPDADGVFRWTYTQAQRDADPVPGGIDVDGLDGTTDPPQFWVEIRQKVGSVYSEPVTLYPKEVTEDDVWRLHNG